MLDLDLRILVTAANPGAGTTTSALALASQLAQMTAMMLLVERNDRQQSDPTAEPEQERGLRDLLFNPDNQDCVVRSQACRSTYWRADPHTMGTDRRASGPLLDQLGGQYRFVVIDGNAVYSAADTLVISTQVV